MRSFFKLLVLAFIFQITGFSEVLGACPSTTGATNAVTNISCFGLTDGSISIHLNTGAAPTNYELYDNNTGLIVPSNVGGVVRTIDPDFMGVTFTNVYASSF